MSALSFLGILWFSHNTLLVDHPSVQYSGHGAPLFVVEFQSDALHTNTTPSAAPLHTHSVSAEEVKYHRLWGAFLKNHFLHPGQLRAVRVSSATVGVNLGPLALKGLHRCLYGEKREEKAPSLVNLDRSLISAIFLISAESFCWRVPTAVLYLQLPCRLAVEN